MANAGGITLSTSSSSLTTIFDVTANGAGSASNVCIVASDSSSGDSMFLFVNGEANYSQVVPPGGSAAIVCKLAGGITKIAGYAGPNGTTIAYLQKVIRP